MGKISSLLTEEFIKRDIITSEKREICRIGIELILADIINFTAILLIGLIAGKFVYGCIYLVLFWTVRRFSGGFHAKTYAVCRTVTIGTFVLVLLAARLINAHLILYTAALDIAAIAAVVLFAPVKHPNKELSDKEIKMNRFFSLVSVLLFAAVSICLVSAGLKEGLCIALTLFAIAVLMLAGLISNRRREGKNDVKVC